MDDTAAARFRATVQNAITHTERVAGEARARADRRRTENAALVQQFRARGARPPESTPTEPGLRAVANQFRTRNGLRVEMFPDASELVPIRMRERARSARVGDEDEDFSQARIMRKADGTTPS